MNGSVISLNFFRNLNDLAYKNRKNRLFMLECVRNKGI